MAKDKIKEDISKINNFQKKKCSICHKEISPGQYYIRDIISNETICSNCDDGQAPIKGDILVSID